jgi:GNAT superfamily N-acetyltransferase
MAVEVRPAGLNDADGVADLLHTHMSAKISRERWRLLLDYPWRPEDADCGQVALDGTRPIGYFGLVYVDRLSQGRKARFCNTSAWYLHKDYRGRGIGQLMQRQAILPDQTYTTLTATKASESALRRAGFKTLDSERCLFSPQPKTGPPLDILEGNLAGRSHLRTSRFTSTTVTFGCGISW